MVFGNFETGFGLNAKNGVFLLWTRGMPDHMHILPGRSIYNYPFAIMIKSKLAVTLWVKKPKCITGYHIGGPLENSHPFSQPRPHTYTHLTVDSNEEEETMLLVGEYCDS